MWPLFLAVTYSIALCLNGGSTHPVILAVQQGEHVIPLDTLRPDNRGCLRFEGGCVLEPGQYMFIQENKRLFNFLISAGEPLNIAFTASIRNGRTEEIRVEGSEENNTYIRFYRFLQEKYARANDILEQNTDPEKALVEVERLEATIREYTSFLASQFEGQMLGIIAKNVFTPLVPPEASTLHYLDNIDFTDPRILNTSILPLRLSEYFTRILPPVPDTVILHADRILKGDIHPMVKRYAAQYFFRLFFGSEVMGMETAAVHMARNWLLADTSLCDDIAVRLEMETFVRFNSQCLTGMPAPALDLPDACGNIRPLHASPTRYTVVVFFEDNCPACSEALLQLVNMSERHQEQDLTFYAVYTQDRKEILSRYADFFPQNWITVWDPDFTSGFHEKYNVRSTPRIYLLDRNKTIIGRDLDPGTLEQLLKDDQQKNKTTLTRVPDMVLETENGESYALSDVTSPFTVLYFYDPACAVCGMITAALYDLFKTADEQKIKVFAVYTGNDYKSWRKWLAEGGYTDWINAWNPSGDDRIHRHFNVNDPPLILLLDAEKHIIADHLSVTALSYILNELISDSL